MDYELTEQQQNIYENIIADLKEVREGDIFGEHSWVSLKGPAGVGKTFLNKAIVQKLLSMGFTIAICAPTHQAVKVIRNTIGIEHVRLKFSSLHSFLGLRPGAIDTKTGERKFEKTPKKKLSGIARERFDICILDESSMVSNELFKFLKDEMYQNNRIESFLFVGDGFQLLPVKDSDSLHAIYDNPNINHYELTELIRNSDMEVIEFVTTIRNMIDKKMTKYDLFNFLVKERDLGKNKKIIFYDYKKDFIKRFISEDRLGKSDDVIGTFTNANVNTYNEKIRNYYVKNSDGVIPEIHPQDLFVVQESTQEDLSLGQNSFINSEILTLKMSKFENFDFKGKKFKGYKCTTSDNRTFNMLAKESFDEYNRACELLRLNALNTKKRENWVMYYDLLKLFLEVRPQFANTVHKLQGSSYRDVYVDLSDLGYVEDDQLLRLMYVGCTRAKQNIHILL
jgi:exodeoxyribonuclease-5